MIIDDDPDIVEMLESALEDDYEVVSAINGLDALSRSREYEPDLFIIDLMMPLMSGWELIERLRAEPFYADRPLVVLTAKDTRDDIKRGYALGANLYLTKPLSLARLLKNLTVFQQQGEFRYHPKTLSMREIRERQMRRRQFALPRVDPLGATPPSGARSQPTPAAPSPEKPREKIKGLRLPPATPIGRPPASAQRADHIEQIDEEEPEDNLGRLDPFSGVDHLFERSPSPATRSSAPADARPRRREHPPMAARVLIADDDPDVLILARQCLADHVQLLETHDGLEAIQKAAQYKPDIFIIDSMMPRMSGFQLCQVIHSSEDFCQTPVIFMAEKGAQTEHLHIERLHISKCLCKPFAPEDLRGALDEIMDQPTFRLRADRPTWQEVLQRERESIRRERQRHQAAGDRSDTRRTLAHFLKDEAQDRKDHPQKGKPRGQ